MLHLLELHAKYYNQQEMPTWERTYRNQHYKANSTVTFLVILEVDKKQSKTYLSKVPKILSSKGNYSHKNEEI